MFKLNFKEYVYLLISVILFTLITYGYYFLIWISFVPLFLYLHNKKFKEGIIGIILFSLMSGILMFTFLLNYKLKIYLLVIVLWIIFYLLFYLISYKLKEKIDFIIVYPIIYLLILIIYSLINLDFMLVNLGVFQVMLSPIIYYIKGFGVSVLIILFNCLLTGYFIRKKRDYLYVIIILLVIIMGCYFYSNNQEYENKFNISIAQGNYPKSWEWRRENVNSILDNYLELTNNASSNGIIVWPEYSLVGNLSIGQLYQISKLAREKNSIIIFGNSLILKDGEYDAAFVINKTGVIQDIYLSILPYIYDNIKKGKKLGLINSELGIFGIIICYEEFNYYLSNKYKKNGAKFLVFMANEMDLDGTRGINLGLQISRLRAAENNILVIRSTNTGVSAIINPYGKVINRLDNNVRGIIKNV